MNILNLYIKTCRLVMQADPGNGDALTELYKTLPFLRQSLTCVVCHHILKNPFSSTDSTCQHYMCETCVSNLNDYQNSCSLCKSQDNFSENIEIKIIVRCYRQLCTYIKDTILYKKLSHLVNGNNYSLIEIINEATENDKIEAKDNNLEAIDNEKTKICDNADSFLGLQSNIVETNIRDNEVINSSTGFDEQEIETKYELNDDIKINKQDLFLSPSKSISPLLTVDSSIISDSGDEKNVSDPLPSDNLLSNSVSSSTDINTVIKTSPGILKDDFNHPSTDSATFPTSVLSRNVSSTLHSDDLDKSNINSVFINKGKYDNSSFNLISGIKQDSPYNNILVTQPNIGSVDLLGNNNQIKIEPSLSTITTYPESSNVQVSSNTGNISTYQNYSNYSVSSDVYTPNSTISQIVNYEPGTIIYSSNSENNVNTQQNIKPNLNKNNELLYSLMPSNNDSTKLAIKHKLPDLENIKKATLPKEKIIFPPQDMKKLKPKPKSKRKGCRCGNATATPGKLTCCGQRCPCYVEAKACIDCQCRGCRNSHRPGGKKVRPIIPQIGNIQIHQIQSVGGRLPPISVTPMNNLHQVNIGNVSSQTSNINTSVAIPQTIRAVHAMHAVQAVQGLGQIHSVPAGLHQFINVRNSIPISSDIKLKPMNFTLSSLPAHLLVHNDKTNSTSDSSDIDI